MANDCKQETQPTESKVVEIRLRGHLDVQWTDRFGGLAVTLEENGDTLLTGQIADQAALFGLLRRVRDLGMQLLSVNCLDTGKQDRPTDNVEKRQHIQKRRRSNEHAECDSKFS